MFADLFSFDKERLPIQALGFYIIFLIIGFFIGAFGGLIFASDWESGLLVGQVLSTIYCLFLGFLILSHKKQLNSAYAFALIIAFILGYFSLVVGLIPVAYLSTIRNLS